jgi:hypothetical protein
VVGILKPHLKSGKLAGTYSSLTFTKHATGYPAMQIFNRLFPEQPFLTH